MKYLFLFFLLLVLPFAVGVGNYGDGNYGEGTYGVSEGAKLVTNDSVEITTEEPLFFNASNATDTSIEFNVDANITGGSITVVKDDTAPENSTSPSGVSTVGKYITIDVSDNIKNNLSSAIISVDYTDSEITGLTESSLRLYRYNGSAWTIYDGQGIGWVDTLLNKIYANTSRFSVWSAFATNTPTPSTSSSGGSSGGGGGGGASVRNLQSGDETTITLLKNVYNTIKINDVKHTLRLLKIVNNEFAVIEFKSTPTEIVVQLNESTGTIIDGQVLRLTLLSVNNNFIKLKIEYGGEPISNKNYTPTPSDTIDEPTTVIDPIIGSINTLTNNTSLPIQDQETTTSESPKKDNMIIYKLLVALAIMVFVMYMIANRDKKPEPPKDDVIEILPPK